MTMGAGLPMGPLALLDFVGLDVSMAIGESIGLEIPEQLWRSSKRARSGARPAEASTTTADRPGGADQCGSAPTPSKRLGIVDPTGAILRIATYP